MAEIRFNVPNVHLPSLKVAMKRLMVVGDAEDLENPTDEEAGLKAKNICIKHLKEVWKAELWKINNESFEFIDPEIE